MSFWSEETKAIYIVWIICAEKLLVKIIFTLCLILKIRCHYFEQLNFKTKNSDLISTKMIAVQ